MLKNHNLVPPKVTPTNLIVRLEMLGQTCSLSILERGVGGVI